MLLNYVREVGPIEVARKVRSRLEERNRNEKFLSCGIGYVLEPADGNDQHPAGQLVVFLAPSHPACVERLALPPELVVSGDPGRIPRMGEGELLYLASDGSPSSSALELAAGWSRHAGLDFDQPLIRTVADDLRAWVYGAPWSRARKLRVDRRAVVRERAWLPSSGKKGTGRNAAKRPSAVLFGYGNYAKTHLLPHVRQSLDVRCVHELDPTQVPPRPRFSAEWDTAPVLRADARFDAYLIAGYHSTHAPLAMAALDEGASVAIEKPIAVSEDQVDRLAASLESSQGRLFPGFQRRYSPLNTLARRDLGTPPGGPISYHCIVYEVPLPARHWYRWPSSGSRLISNGCHWIDHFLYLNRYCGVTSSDLFAARDSTLNCSLELENGAVFTMALTDRGSSRLGVRDQVELRSGDVTVSIVNDSRYRSEDSVKVLRRAHVSPTKSYVSMYTEIARRIRAGEPGDSPGTVRASAGAVLELDRRLVAH
jgi:predicted dehydrogenase